MNGTEKLALLDCNHQWWCDPRTYRWDKADTAAKMRNDDMEKHPEHRAQLELGIWPGPCSRCGSSESDHGFNYCSGCSVVWCTKCTQAEAVNRLEETKKRYLYDKVMNASKDEPSPYHIWSHDRLKMKEAHVSPVSRTRNKDKLEWLRLELSGDSAPLVAFRREVQRAL